MTFTKNWVQTNYLFTLLSLLCVNLLADNYDEKVAEKCHCEVYKKVLRC